MYGGVGGAEPRGSPLSRSVAHSGDDGGPSWRPVIKVVLPPLWHQGHKGQPMPRTAAGAITPGPRPEGPRLRWPHRRAPHEPRRKGRGGRCHQQDTAIDRTPLARMLPSVIGSMGSLKRAIEPAYRRRAAVVERAVAQTRQDLDKCRKSPMTSSQGISLSRRPHDSSHGPQQRGNLPPGLNRLGRIAAALEGVGVTLGSARRLSAVQSTPAVRPRGRSTDALKMVC